MWNVGGVTMSKIVKQCKNCLKKLGDECPVFLDPAYQWREGKKCFGYTDNPVQMAKIYGDMARYTLQYKGMSETVKYYKRMADEWKRAAIEKSGE